MSRLISGKPLSSIEACNDTISKWITIPSGQDVKLEELYALICSINTTYIADELVQSLDLQEMLKQAS